MIQTADGGYALAGSWGFWLVKTDASGLEEWSQTFWRAEWDNALSVIQTTDGGYAVAGHTSEATTTADGFELEVLIL